MTKHKSWNVLIQVPGDLGLAVLFGLTFFTGFALMGKGMLVLGPLDASVDFGVQQSTQMLGGQAVDILAGEWRHVCNRLRSLILILVLAMIIMSYGNML